MRFFFRIFSKAGRRARDFRKYFEKLRLVFKIFWKSQTVLSNKCRKKNQSLFNYFVLSHSFIEVMSESPADYFAADFAHVIALAGVAPGCCSLAGGCWL